MTRIKFTNITQAKQQLKLMFNKNAIKTQKVQFKPIPMKLGKHSHRESITNYPKIKRIGKFD